MINQPPQSPVERHSRCVHQRVHSRIVFTLMCSLLHCVDSHCVHSVCPLPRYLHTLLFVPCRTVFTRCVHSQDIYTLSCVFPVALCSLGVSAPNISTHSLVCFLSHPVHPLCVFTLCVFTHWRLCAHPPWFLSSRVTAMTRRSC